MGKFLEAELNLKNALIDFIDMCEEEGKDADTLIDEIVDPLLIEKGY